MNHGFNYQCFLHGEFKMNYRTGELVPVIEFKRGNDEEIHETSHHPKIPQKSEKG